MENQDEAEVEEITLERLRKLLLIEDLKDTLFPCCPVCGRLTWQDTKEYRYCGKCGSRPEIWRLKSDAFNPLPLDLAISAKNLKFPIGKLECHRCGERLLRDEDFYCVSCGMLKIMAYMPCPHGKWRSDFSDEIALFLFDL